MNLKTLYLFLDVVEKPPLKASGQSLFITAKSFNKFS